MSINKRPRVMREAASSLRSMLNVVEFLCEIMYGALGYDLMRL